MGDLRSRLSEGLWKRAGGTGGRDYTNRRRVLQGNILYKKKKKEGNLGDSRKDRDKELQGGENRTGCLPISKKKKKLGGEEGKNHKPIR